MAPGSQAPADVPAGRSGGKILKARRTAARKTPYDRPTPPQPEPPLLQSESPSWLGGLAMPAKFVAGGASKFLSSIWNPKSWATASYSSSDSDSEPEDDSGDDENPPDTSTELNQKENSSQKAEILHLVEQLLMLERYSREECDKLIDIINSRVLDYFIRDAANAGPSIIHSKTNNNETEAIMEARKWVAENKVTSGKKPDLDNGLYALKYIMTPQGTEEEGSPVEVAKSYMKTRPPWASPLKHDNSPSPSPLRDLFKENTPYSPSTKRDFLSSGSWNIQDEIRKVRSKASEDMLNSHRSMKLLEHSMENNKSDEIVDLTSGEKEKESEGNGREKEEEGNENGIVEKDSEVPAVNNSQESFNSKEDGLVAKVSEDGMTENIAVRVRGRSRRGKRSK
ncbi:hypothetical protein LXL04_025932 [Taraxacum kok-saghyz]